MDRASMLRMAALAAKYDGMRHMTNKKWSVVYGDTADLLKEAGAEIERLRTHIDAGDVVGVRAIMRDEDGGVVVTIGDNIQGRRVEVHPDGAIDVADWDDRDA